MDFAIIKNSPFLKSKQYCPNPIVKFGIPSYADSIANPKVKNTPAYNQWWEEQIYYIKNGYDTGGLHIPGRYYYFVNFCTIRSITGDNVRPEIHDYQLDYSYLIEEAKSEGKMFNIILPKARRKAATTMNICMVIDYGYRFSLNYKAAIVAGKQVFADVFYDEWRYVDSKTMPEFRIKKLKQGEITEAGWKQKTVDGDIIEQGTHNVVYSKTVFSDPNVLKGLFLHDIVLEESGENEHLVEVFNASRDCLMKGSMQYGTMHLFGCVCAGTKVWNASGNLVNIEDLKQSEGILGYSGTGPSIENIIWMKPPAQKPCYRITTTGNNTIECSEDHPLMWSRNRFLKWRNGKNFKKITFKRAAEVMVGDQLMLLDEVNVFGRERKWHPRLLGLLIGDGNVTNGKSPSIGACEKGIQNYLEDNFNVSIAKKGAKKNFITSNGLHFKSYTIKGITDNLRSAGIYGLVGRHKRLPFDIGSYDKYSLSELLGGYFDADGNVKITDFKKVQVVLTSIVPELLEEVKFQLTKFGIGSSIYKELRNTDSGYGNSDCIYRLYISKHKSVLLFHKNISFLCEHKQKALDFILTLKKNGRNSNDRYIFELNKNNNKGQYYVGMDFLKSLRQEFVTKVEYIGMKDVYNLNAGATHTYLANNFVTGNTGGNMDKGSKGFKKIWYDASKFNCKQHFIPATVFLHPHYAGAKDISGKIIEDIPNLLHLKPHERVGMSDEKRAAEIIRAESDRLLKIGDLEEYFNYGQNNPITIKEVFRKSASNNFDNIKLNDQGHRILSEAPKYSKFKLIFKTDAQGNTLMPYEVLAIPAKDDVPEAECVMILDEGHPMPMWSRLDVAGNDAYDQDQSKQSKSLGSMVVFRRQHNMDKIPQWCPVALIRNRPKRKEEYYELSMKLAIYYNLVGTVLCDARTPMIMKHFQDRGCERFLSRKTKKFSSVNSSASNEYGQSLNIQTRPLMVSALQSFFYMHTEKVWFPYLIDEALNYDEFEVDSDNDTIDALGLALMKALDMTATAENEEDRMANDPYAYPTWGTNANGNVVDIDTVKASIKKNPLDKEDFFSRWARLQMDAGEDDEPASSKDDIYSI